MASRLGSGFEIIEEGPSARTTNLDDPADPRLNGSACLPSALAGHLPLSFAILMLGTNYAKSVFLQTPYEIANGMYKLLGQILRPFSRSISQCWRLHYGRWCRWHSLHRAE